MARPPLVTFDDGWARLRPSIELGYLVGQVLPQLKELEAGALLGEVGRRWVHYRRLVRWLKFFTFLDRFHTKRQNLPSTGEVAMVAFRATIFPLVEGDRAAVLQRDGDASWDWQSLQDLFDVMQPAGLAPEPGPAALQQPPLPPGSRCRGRCWATGGRFTDASVPAQEGDCR